MFRQRDSHHFAKHLLAIQVAHSYRWRTINIQISDGAEGLSVCYIYTNQVDMLYHILKLNSDNKVYSCLETSIIFLFMDTYMGPYHNLKKEKHSGGKLVHQIWGKLFFIMGLLKSSH